MHTQVNSSSRVIASTQNYQECETVSSLSADSRLRTACIVKQELEEMPLDAVTKEITRKFDLAFASGSRERIKQAFGAVVAEYISRPEFHQAVEVVVRTFAKYDVQMPLSVIDGGAFVIGSLKTGCTYFRSNGSYEDFYGLADFQCRQ